MRRLPPRRQTARESVQVSELARYDCRRLQGADCDGAEARGCVETAQDKRAQVGGDKNDTGDPETTADEQKAQACCSGGNRHEGQTSRQAQAPTTSLEGRPRARSTVLD